MAVSIAEIDNYLTEVKESIKNKRYRLDTNSKRLENRRLFDTYLISTKEAEEIILNLTAKDFSAAVQNEHQGYENETLYIFGKDVELLERYGNNVKRVSLYIKFNKLKNQFVIVISFHEQRYPLTYYFK